MTAAHRVLSESVFYPEGPLWEDGRLTFVEYARDSVSILDLVDLTTTTLWQRAGFGPAGLARAADGSLWVTGSDGNALARVDREGRGEVVVTHDVGGSALPAPNDLVFNAAGDLYFTASGIFDPAAAIAGGVYLHRREGGTHLVAGDIHYANGIALSMDGSTLFVAEHLRNRILAFAVLADGTLGERRVHADLADLAGLTRVVRVDDADPLLGPDGLACTREGRLCVAHFAGGRLLVLAPDGSLERNLVLPYRYPTNVAFGADETAVYVTAMQTNAPPYGGALLEVQLA